MASSLSEFMAIEPEETRIETIAVKAKNGKTLEVDVKNLNLEQFKKVKKASTDSYNNASGGAAVAQIEDLTFSQKLCAAGIVDPPLTNAKLRARHNVHSNEELVAALFPPRSIVQMGMRIMDLTLGEEAEVEITDGTDPKKVEEAKN